jgi:hypothetical protein
MSEKPICFECVHYMKLKMMVEMPIEAGPMRGRTTVQTIEGAACKLASVPIGGPTVTLECSEFEQRLEPALMKKPEPAMADA